MLPKSFLPKTFLPKFFAVAVALIFVALIGQPKSARAIGVGGICAGQAGFRCDDGLWCEINRAPASAPTRRAAACACRIPAACRFGRFAPAVDKPTAAIAGASAPRRRRITTDLAGSRRRTIGLMLDYCRAVAGAPTRTDAICGLAVFAIGSCGTAKAPPIMMPPRNTAMIVAITTPSRRGGTWRLRNCLSKSSWSCGSIAISSPVQCTYRTRWPATRSRIFLSDGSETFPQITTGARWAYTKLRCSRPTQEYM